MLGFAKKIAAKCVNYFIPDEYTYSMEVNIKILEQLIDMEMENNKIKDEKKRLAANKIIIGAQRRIILMEQSNLKKLMYIRRMAIKEEMNEKIHKT